MNLRVKPPVRIPVSRGGDIVAHALVDPGDAELVASYRWSLNGRGYVMGAPGFLHRVILGLERGDRKYVDHRNGDPLDNRRDNLEIVAQKENTRRAHRELRHNPPAERTEFALRIKRARYEAGFRQADLASRLGVSTRAVQTWEYGMNRPRPTVLRRLAEVTGKPLDWFFEERVAA